MLVISWSIYHWQTQNRPRQVRIAHYNSLDEYLIVIVLPSLRIILIAQRLTSIRIKILSKFRILCYGEIVYWPCFFTIHPAEGTIHVLAAYSYKTLSYTTEDSHDLLRVLFGIRDHIQHHIGS